MANALIDAVLLIVVLLFTISMTIFVFIYIKLLWHEYAVAVNIDLENLELYIRKRMVKGHINNNTTRFYKLGSGNEDYFNIVIVSPWKIGKIIYSMVFHQRMFTYGKYRFQSHYNTTFIKFKWIERHLNKRLWPYKNVIKHLSKKQKEASFALLGIRYESVKERELNKIVYNNRFIILITYFNIFCDFIIWLCSEFLVVLQQKIFKYKTIWQKQQNQK